MIQESVFHITKNKIFPTISVLQAFQNTAPIGVIFGRAVARTEPNLRLIKFYTPDSLADFVQLLHSINLVSSPNLYLARFTTRFLEIALVFRSRMKQIRFQKPVVENQANS